MMYLCASLTPTLFLFANLNKGDADVRDATRGKLDVAGYYILIVIIILSACVVLCMTFTQGKYLG